MEKQHRSDITEETYAIFIAQNCKQDKSGSRSAFKGPAY